MNNRISTLNKSFFERKIDSDEKERCKRNRVNNINTLISNNYEKAMNSENADKWKDVINEKLKILYGSNVMKIVENKNILEVIKPFDVIWVITIKDNGIYKARLVVKGFRQIKGVFDYTCTYSPKIEMDSFRLTIAAASIYKWDLK